MIKNNTNEMQVIYSEIGRELQKICFKKKVAWIIMFSALGLISLKYVLDLILI